MVKANILRKRLRKLDEYLSILRRLQQYKFDEFASDPERYGSAERFLHLAIEATLDIGNHIIADDNLGEVDWYSDIPHILAEHHYIDAALKETWIKMIGFRNILVHQYTDIDRKIVYNVLQSRLEDIEALEAAFAKLL